MEAKLQQQAPQKTQVNKPNLTGIPTQMKLDFERWSGLSFDDVRVHYNSDKPAQLQALAYTQGTQVYVGPGQERHLPHELGHVIQQKMGIVRQTKTKNGVGLNDSPWLEKMADRIVTMPSITRICPTNQRRQHVIQCAGEVGAAVSLIPSGSEGHNFGPSELVVDSISIWGRFKTGLLNKTEDGETQGDHTIADVLVKREQNVKGQDVNSVLEDYAINAERIKEDVEFAWEHAVQGLGKNLKKRDKKILDEYKIPDAYKSFNLGKVGFPSSTFSRFKQAKDLALNIGSTVKNLKGEKQPISKWSVALERVILAYNEAYAYSPYSTQGKEGTGGHCEGIGNGFVGKYLNDVPNKHRIKAESLFDFESAKKLPDRFIIIPSKKFGDLMRMITAIQPLISTTPKRKTMKTVIDNIVNEMTNATSSGHAEIHINRLYYKYIQALYKIVNRKEEQIRKLRHIARIKMDEQLFGKSPKI